MNLNGYCVLALLVAGLVAVQGKGKITCFRKLKRNGKCAGIIRKGSFESREECCEKGAGFALKKTKVGKNRFRCDPCNQNEVLIKPTKRTKVKKTPKVKKERKPKKVKGKAKAKAKAKVKSRPTLPPPPAVETKRDKTEPIVEIKPKESWYSPSRRTDISYSYVDPEKEKVRWGPWSPCSVTCGAGWRSRFKVCDDCDKNDYENVQSQPCMVNFYCPVDGNWGPWFPWQPCSLSCGGGHRVRQRKCNYPPPAYGGLACPGPGENNQTCNEKFCPVNGVWGSWSEFSLCSVTCGQGVKRRTRACDSPLPSHGGKNCVGSHVLSKKCQNPRCPQDGGWSLWGTWSPCEVTCGAGTRTRTRTCDSPRALYGGKDCEGEGTESVACYGGRACPVDGGWSEWTNFGYCRAQRCERGYQVRSRSCTQPKPRQGGRPCEGDQYERVDCFNDQGCPVNGTWCEWSDWSKCTASCKQDTALRVRQRECKCPAPKNDGTECDGEGIIVKTCDDLPPCVRPAPTQRSDTRADGEEKEISRGTDAEGDSSGNGPLDDYADEEDEGEDYPDHTEMEGK